MFGTPPTVPLLRDDDIFLTESPTSGKLVYNFEQFISVHETIAASGRLHCLGIVAGEIENHPELRAYIRTRPDEFEYAVHGWLHERYTKWHAEYITNSLRRAKGKIAKTFGVVPRWFFAPWNQVNDGVRSACEALDLLLDERCADPNYFLNGGKGEVLGFHYWHDAQVRQLCEWLRQVSVPA